MFFAHLLPKGGIMRISNSNVIRMLYIVALLFMFISAINAQAIIQPEQDVIVVTFGGGEGCNVFAKYNISPVPSGVSIDSVFITPYVIAIGGSWDGDAYYWNVNDQAWHEGDSCNHIYSLPTSDQTTQASGFGTTAGWTKSVSLTDIFLTDYNAGHVYCSIKIKDPDDMTSVPMPGSMPVNAETLAVGNIIFDEYTIFYAREYPNAPPWLVVYYHSVGVNELSVNTKITRVEVKPNPMNKTTCITLCATEPIVDNTIRIYNVTGTLIKECSLQPVGYERLSTSWDGTDLHNNPVPSGSYFCVVTGEGEVFVKSVCVIR